jgi:pSer/pThr/pTyr-binding forkhead associated (FHA) protein
MIYSTAERLRQPVDEGSGRRPQRAIVLAEGKRFAVAPTGASIGRSRECDIVLGDANVSRRHAEVRPARTSEATWTIADAGSTNGVRVNGRNAEGAHPLRHGDRIELGTADLTFELE